MSYHHVYGTESRYPQLEQRHLTIPIGDITFLTDHLPGECSYKGAHTKQQVKPRTYPPDFLICATT